MMSEQRTERFVKILRKKTWKKMASSVTSQQSSNQTPDSTSF